MILRWTETNEGIEEMDVEEFAMAVSDLAADADLPPEDFVFTIAGLLGCACAPADDPHALFKLAKEIADSAFQSAINVN